MAETRWGKPEHLTMVPGNHDAYVQAVHETGLGLLNPYGRRRQRQRPCLPLRASPRRNVAIIGVSSAVPSVSTGAGGALGQRTSATALASRLADLGTRGFYAFVMIHHPPLPGLTPARRALTDAAELREV